VTPLNPASISLFKKREIHSASLDSKSPFASLRKLLIELFRLERLPIESAWKKKHQSSALRLLLADETACNRDTGRMGIYLLAAVQLLDGSLDRFALGVGDGSKAAELSSVVIARQVHVFDLAVLLDDGA